MATNVKDLPVELITVPPSHRKPSQEKVTNLAESLRRKKRMLQPIMVRKYRDTYLLVFGGHRLAAAKILKWETIPAIMADGMSELECELAEIDENVVRANLTIAQEALALARRKAIYLQLYPDTAQGTAGAIAKHAANGDSATAPGAVAERPMPSFAADTAATTGMAERTVHDRVQSGENLSPKAVSILGDSPAANSKAQVKALSELPKAEQIEVAKAIRDGEATSVHAAIAATEEHETEDDDGLVVEFLTACNTDKIKATKAQREKFAEFDEDSQRAFVIAIVNGWQSLSNALSTGEVAEPPIEEKIKEHNAAVDADCRAMRKALAEFVTLFENTMDKPHHNGPWAKDLKRRNAAIDKFKAAIQVEKFEDVLETIRSWKVSKPCPMCKGEGCKDCHNTSMVTTQAYQQLVG